MSPTADGLAGRTTTTEYTGTARQAQDRVTEPASPGGLRGGTAAVPPRAAAVPQTSRPAGSQSHLPGGTSTSPLDRGRAVAGMPSPGTGAADPAAGNRLPASPVRGRTQTPAGASDSDSPPAGSRAAAVARLGSIPPWPTPPVPGDVLLQIRLSLPPVTESRARISPAEYTWTGGRKVKTKKAHGYKEPALAEYQETVGWLLRRCRVTRNDTDELGVYGVFHLGRNAGAADGDNLLKAIVDAGNGIAWRDDRQFVTWLARVVRGSADPHTDLVVYVADDGPRTPGGAV